MSLNSLTRLVIFHLPLWIPFPPLLCTLDWGVGGADLHIPHHLGSPVFWLPVGFGRRRHWLDPRSGETEAGVFLLASALRFWQWRYPLRATLLCCPLPRFWLLLSTLQEHCLLPSLLWDGSQWVWVIVFH